MSARYEEPGVRVMARALIRLAFGLSIAFLISACSMVVGDFPSEQAPMQTVNPAEGYRLEAGNKVRINVFNEPNLSGEYVVDQIGNIAVPLVGNIPAAGVTARELARRVEDRLKKDNFLQSPDVAAEVQTFRPFYVLGEVRQPGEFPYTTGLTVLSAIARAGGYDYRASQGRVVLVRTVDGAQKEFLAVERTPILPGDIVKVLERRF